MMKTICLAGKNEIAVRALYEVKKSYPHHSLVVIPNKTDPGYNHWQPSLIYHARKMGVPILSLEEVYEIPDLVFISLEFDMLLRPDRFQTNQLFNIHFSALPKYKGMYTSVHPLLNGEAESGVTLHCIDPGIDTGDIIDQKIFPLDSKVTARQLYQLYLTHSFDLFQKNLRCLVEGGWKSRVQDFQNASYYAKSSLNFSEIHINFQKTAWEIANQFRAFHFREYQMPRFQDWEIAGTEILSQKSQLKPGAIVEETDAWYEVATIDFNVRLIKDYYSIFWMYAAEGKLEEMKREVAFIPDIDLRNNQGWNALILASYNGHLETVNWLLAQGANPKSTNFKGTTLPMYGLGRYEKTSKDEMLKFWLKAGLDLNAKDDSGLSILDYAKDEPARRMILEALS